MGKHSFAIYKENLSELVTSLRDKDFFSFKDTIVWNRLIKILRIKPQEKFILFDEKNYIELVAHEDMLANKRMIVGTIVKKIPNIPLDPKISLLLPILKKEAFEQATYVAAQMGVQEIVPIITEKSEQSIAEKERDRLQKIIIAACEQSKNFIPPLLREAKPFSQSIDQKDFYKICFDGREKPMYELIDELKKQPRKNLLVTLGPEGGFVEHEKKSLQTAGFTFYALTPTILRSREAVTVGLGIIRGITSPQKSAP